MSEVVHCVTRESKEETIIDKEEFDRYPDLFQLYEDYQKEVTKHERKDEEQGKEANEEKEQEVTEESSTLAIITKSNAESMSFTELKSYADNFNITDRSHSGLVKELSSAGHLV